jgi:guanyl-specific ribonuclease Sa
VITKSKLYLEGGTLRTEALLARMLAKSEQAVAQSQGMLEAAKRAVQTEDTNSSSSAVLPSSHSDHSTEDETLASMDLPTSVSDLRVRI